MSQVAERWCTMIEMTKHLGVSRDIVLSRIEKYNMPSIRIGRLWQFRMSDADARMEFGSTAK